MIKISADNVDNSNNNRQTEREREREKETARQKQQNKSNSLRANPFNFRPATAHRGERGRKGSEREACYVRSQTFSTTSLNR